MSEGPRGCDLEWGHLVDDDCGNNWRHWPRRQREACAGAIDRALGKAFATIRPYFPDVRIVSDVSTCEQRTLDGRWQLYRCVKLRG